MLDRTKIIIRKFGRIIICLSLVSVATAGLYMLSNLLFKLESIEVISEGINIEFNQEHLVTNLLLFPSRKLRDKIIKDYPLLADVKIIKKYPHTLAIITSKRSPFAVVQSGKGLFNLDKEAIVLSEATGNQGLPILIFDSDPLHIGKKLTDERIKQSLAILINLGNNLNITSITSLDESSLRAKAKDTEIYFSGNSDIETKVDTLQTLLTGFRIKGTLPTIIDLRFDKPIVKF